MENISLECGWGKLIFAETFSSAEKLAQEMKKERKTARNIAFDLQNPQIFFSQFPTNFFLNPAYIYRFELKNFSKPHFSFDFPEYTIRTAQTEEDIAKLDEIYRSLDMLPIGAKWLKQFSKAITILVVEDKKTQKILGGVMYINHQKISERLGKKASLWALAISPNAPFSGLGKKLVQSVLHSAKTEEIETLFLSVVASNAPAISLYENMGFEKTNILTLKNKTAINQKFFMCQTTWKNVSKKDMILVDEALKRGIHTEIVADGFFRFAFSGRQLHYNEGITEMTNAMSEANANNKKIFSALLQEEKFPMRPFAFLESFAEAKKFLETHKKIWASSLKTEYFEDNISTQQDLQKKIRKMQFFHDEVFVQKQETGKLFRCCIIDAKVVSVISFSAPSITGTGEHTVHQLISKINRRRHAKTPYENTIPLDMVTKNFLQRQKYTLESILENGKNLVVRPDSVFETGGSIEEKTDVFATEGKILAQKVAKKLGLMMAEVVLEYHETEGFFVKSVSPSFSISWHSHPTSIQRLFDFLFPRTKNI